MSHSKRNTSRPIFTSHERAMAKAAWGSSSARLSRESFLPFASCCLCLETAIDPVACAHGDIFCRECALSNILAQKQEIKRGEKAREHEERENLEDDTRKNLEAQERAIREFELTQAGLSVRTGGRPANAQPEAPTKESELPYNVDEETGAKRGEKRKFSLDGDEVARIATEERAKARKAIEDEKASKPILPSFWSPSVTPSSNKSNVLHDVKKKIKIQPVCPASQPDSAHYYSLHTLITVNFTEETDTEKKTTQRICPACKRALSNTSKAMLAKPCGHVLCKSCVDKFMRPTGRHDPHAPDSDPDVVRCYVCEADLTEIKQSAKKEGKAEKEKIKPGLVELHSEGTGFSGSGANQVKRDKVNFQC
ncbi:hypothetical protein B0T25DRAFT_144812 [Lasiosphaeria hispida]|uniref:RING-type domain-containing protein n=1 Tax=Lasiosphaeria hispida TaxID=260671 RepID=A0AAJ0MFT6_9PEZI|nr:hypothetical protein B0T25DRAFT_144812 [Lasiosphaeria hispida]